VKKALVVSVVLMAAACATPEEPVMPAAPPTTGLWETLEEGLELAAMVSPQEAEIGDSTIRVLRIDPERFELRLLNATATEERRGLTAGDWCRRFDCVAAINASMYQTDHLTSISLMRTREHVNNPRLTKHNMILAFDRLEGGVPPVKLIDRECDELDEWRERYGSLVQSIRMLSCQGENVWSQQPKKWSTAAIGTDLQGRVLFIHVRSPYSTHDLIDILSRLPIDLDRAMYVEGGPEAQLYVRSGDREEEFIGSYETTFFESNTNNDAWAVPNVVAVARRD
jgi:hypothetical protein